MFTQPELISDGNSSTLLSINELDELVGQLQHKCTFAIFNLTRHR